MTPNDFVIELGFDNILDCFSIVLEPKVEEDESFNCDIEPLLTSINCRNYQGWAYTNDDCHTMDELKNKLISVGFTFFKQGYPK